MVYRLYLETAPTENGIGWAFMFYNHQDFCVYKRCGKSVGQTNEQVILEQSATALSYFSNFMRKRYYDEHFATILDEDYITLFTEMPAIAETAARCNREQACAIGFIGENKDLWEAMVPFFTCPSMTFETATDERFITAAKELAKQGLNK